MKKCFLFVIAIFYCVLTFAQKTIDGLINAEKSFAAYSVSHSTKEAFLKFLDSNGVVFDQGKPVNGIELWNKREKRPGVLDWHPVYADLSASGDFGFTSGPWTYRQSANDTVVARGEYTTVWHIDKNGEWKFLVDLGVQNTPEHTAATGGWKRKPVDTDVYKSTLQSLSEKEEEFIARTATVQSRGMKRIDWYKENAAANMVLNRNGHLYAPYDLSSVDIVNDMPERIQYTVNGSGIASTGDLGYVYGTTVVNSKTDNYIRIWKREKEGWKLLFEVLRF